MPTQEKNSPRHRPRGPARSMLGRSTGMDRYAPLVHRALRPDHQNQTTKTPKPKKKTESQQITPLHRHYNPLTIKIAHVPHKPLHRLTASGGCDHNTRRPTGSHRTRRRHPCMAKAETGATATDNLSFPLTHSTHTYTHPLCQNSHPRLSTGIPSYEYHTPPSIMGGTDETTHQIRNTQITCACPPPLKLTSHFYIVPLSCLKTLHC
jgi:hypothetical protein